jgi:hypothetical protein
MQTTADIQHLVAEITRLQRVQAGKVIRADFVRQATRRGLLLPGLRAAQVYSSMSIIDDIMHTLGISQSKSVVHVTDDLVKTIITQLDSFAPRLMRSMGYRDMQFSNIQRTKEEQVVIVIKLVKAFDCTPHCVV